VKPVFADTFYRIALTNRGDLHAEVALRFDDLLSGGYVTTTEEVLTGLLTFFAGDSWLRNRAVETVRELLSDDAVRIIPQSHESFWSGFDLYASRPDKGYSLTDCISMQTMRREGLTEVLTATSISSRKVFALCSGIPKPFWRGRLSLSQCPQKACWRHSNEFHPILRSLTVMQTSRTSSAR
jgi:predicted nucleic acid-binding protein